MKNASRIGRDRDAEYPYFCAAAAHGRFRKAGKALAVQESSISRRVRDLEDRLGASLCQRFHGGVLLTSAGRRFLRQAMAALSHLSEGAREVSAIGRGEDGHIRVGIFSSLASGFLSDLFQAYNALPAEVRIDFVDGDPAEHITAVRRHLLDAAFLAGIEQRDECETTPLWSEQIFAVLLCLASAGMLFFVPWPRAAGFALLGGGMCAAGMILSVFVHTMIGKIKEKADEQSGSGIWY